MWLDSKRDWQLFSPDFIGDAVDPERATGPWSGHRDFAYDLIRWRQPGTLVELGTHYGVSFFSFCQAVNDSGATTALHAIDTWQGDEHAGFYGEEVFDTFNDSLSQLEPSDVSIHRSTFADALDEFDDETIDLLHIDGFHSYEALKEDFETWLPKLAQDGLVLLHDVSEASGYGSARYYVEEVAGRYPGFAFEHNFGLGVVLPKGTRGWDFLLSEEFARWRETYARTAGLRTLERVEAGQARMIEERVELIRDLEARLHDLELTLERKDTEIADRDLALGSVSRQLRQAQDRAQQLAPLEVSTKAQLKALRHSLPRAARNRLRRFREGRGPRKRQGQQEADESHGPPAAPDPTAALKKGVSLAQILGDVVGRRFEPERDDVVRALFEGSPVSDEHALRLERSHRPPEARAEPGQAQLFQGSKVTSGPVSELVRSSGMTGVDLLTIDVWDTLILRRRPADAAKTATARRIVLSSRFVPAASGMDPFEVAALRAGIEAELSLADASGEYELSEVLTLLLERLGHDAGFACRELAARLAAQEEQDEARWSVARSDVAELLDTGSENGSSGNGRSAAMLLSDFYMDSGALGRIVSEVTGTAPELLVSVDVGKSKRVDGALFDEVRLRSNVPAERHLHIGDNRFSDVENQVRSGGLAIYTPRDETFPPAGEFTRETLSPCWAELDRQLDSIEPGREEIDPYRQSGRELSVFAVALVAGAIEAAHQAGVDRVHYLSREGRFLSELHELVEPVLTPDHLESIRGIHLEVSRRSTFGASLEQPYDVSLHRMWAMYSRQSVAAMLTSMGMDPEDQVGNLAAAGLSPDTQLADAVNDPRVADLMRMPSFIRDVDAHVSRVRGLLEAYVLERTALTDPFIVVDIGWRGTIQDNLVRALGIQRSHGVYFGLFPFLNSQPPGVTKTAVAFDANRGDRFEFAEPPAVLERPWTPHEPSTIAYERVDGTVKPVHERESGDVSPGIDSFQKGTLEAAPVVAEWLVGMGLTTDVLREDLAFRAERAWTDPPEGLADIWFESAHDDTFGALNQVGFAKPRPDASWLEGDLRDHIRAGEQGSGWPEGYRSWSPVRALLELNAVWTEGVRG